MEEADLLGQGGILHNDGTAENVGVAAEVLRGRVHDDVGTQRQRLLEVGRGEGVVDDDDRTNRVADLGERGDVADLHERIARSLNPEHLGRVGTECGAHRIEVAEVCRAQRRAPGHEHPVNEPVGAAVDVVAHQHVVAGREKCAQEGVFCGKAGGEAVRVGAALERGEQLLQRVARRVAAASVLVAVAEAADAVLHEGGRQVHGGNDRTRRWIEGLARRDGAGLEGKVLWQLVLSIRTGRSGGPDG